MSARWYADELTKFEERQINFIRIAEAEFEDHIAIMKKSPEIAAIRSVNLFEDVATRKLALRFLELFGEFRAPACDSIHKDSYKRFFDELYSLCENTLIAMSKTPQDKTLGERLLYDAMRDRYSHELVYLSARKNFIERK
jgi:hypothetical protein